VLDEVGDRAYTMYPEAGEVGGVEGLRRNPRGLEDPGTMVRSIFFNIAVFTAAWRLY